MSEAGSKRSSLGLRRQRLPGQRVEEVVRARRDGRRREGLRGGGEREREGEEEGEQAFHREAFQRVAGMMTGAKSREARTLSAMACASSRVL